ncbi:ribosome-associated translation inhibitor RaiA [Candidatus Aminicenantes bacterium AC-335-B20]|jgi:putative sigma-54 modulation protein|nr:ribosome-associated translation inhibitor RaiA [SCandidatus Aminicenantes bacterium Aminicenantia_JdfR_composite]MCP2596393.1 ribosome-associated translation inhibitor RaiA [Candidatus Aminicenantes bacterium AC-335-G13]MCP2599260.1 ribosome-associated translation inhibitor RaiA [Candidatus Aminicenantes bacterium AC-335-B20]MCP2618229.1 ribosome-associated translation inhibitor RaiA [Candidatus Aminicenantes bacterium AC-335-A11]MCP2619489.1 ribosome-associated translation inhibitor RaiA [C
MNISYTGRNMEITQDLKKYTEKRLRKIEKFIGPLLEAEVIFSTEKFQRIVEINLKSKNFSFNAKEKAKEVYMALNTVFDQLERRVKKAKEKLKEERKRAGRITTPAEQPLTPKYNISRNEVLTLKPMSLDEAIEYMNISNREIFAFTDLESGSLQILHKRKSGNYDLIEVK